VSSGGPPRTLAGRYRLEAVIGRGGMSTVYRAADLALDRTVAVKVALDPLAEANPVYVARFKREARAAAALSHPNAVTVYDAGADGATRFIVMEYVEGRSLAQILRDEGRLEPERAARITEQVADALAAAHAAGIIHRDIKPGNVMVSAQDHVKVLDFGIARTRDAVTLTQTASVMGTAPYMSPEQAMGRPADARSDIYSLGCVLYEMLTGKPPFMADVPAAVLHQHVSVEATPPSAANPDVPPALDALVIQMLAKDPEERPQTAGEVCDRLTAYAAKPNAPTEPTKPLPGADATEATTPMGPAAGALAGAAAAAAEVPQVATAAQPATVPPEATDAGAATTQLQPPSPPHRSRRGLWTTLAVLSAILLGAAVALALSGGGSTASSSTRSHGTTPPASSTAAPPETTHSSSTPTSSTAPSSTSTSTSTSSTASSTATTSVTTSATTPGPTGGAPPASGGAPPGQAKKGKNK
jgi:eukaryotic-like serine/threonine-protein kinase